MRLKADKEQLSEENRKFLYKIGLLEREIADLEEGSDFNINFLVKEKSDFLF